MKHILKKSMALLLALTLTFMSFPLLQVSADDVTPTTELAETGFCGAPWENDGKNVMWNFDKATGTLTISGAGDMLNNFSSTSPFANNSSIKTVIINNDVTSVSSYTFFNCSNLKSVKIGDSVTRVDPCTFSGNTPVKEFIVSDNNTTFSSEDGVLYNKDKTLLVKYPCDGKDGYIIPDSVTALVGDAFSWCKNLTSITIPKNVTLLDVTEALFFEMEGFTHCYNLLEINVDESNQNYSSIDGALYNKNKTELLKCPTGKKGEFIIPSTVNEFRSSYAFESCDFITSIQIPASVTHIGGAIFGNAQFASCKSLKEITVDKDNQDFSSLDGILYNKDKTTLIRCPIDKSDNIAIPNSVTLIDDQSFADCDNLTRLVIPNSVNFIGTASFGDCNSLVLVEIPSTTCLSGSAFTDCNNLTIKCEKDSDAYNYAKGKFPIILVDYKLNIETGFCGDPDVNDSENVSWKLEKATGLFTISGNGDMFMNSESPFFCEKPYIKTVVIENGVTSIGWDAFSGCTDLTSITISDSVTDIRNEAFKGCTGLISITIPNSVIGINEAVFAGCSSLTSITIPNSVTFVGDGAFGGCTGLTSITLSNSITCIRNSMLSDCSSLTSIVIPDSVTEIWEYSFEGCTSLTSITIPSSVTTIEYAAFEGCTSLTSITIPSSVTTIEYAAFKGCDNLIIKCEENSYAHQYAKDNTIKFELIDDEPTTPPTSSDSTSSDATSSDATSSEPTQPTNPVATITKGNVSGTDRNGNEIKAGDIVVNDINEDKLSEKEKESVKNATENPQEFIKNALENIVLTDVTVTDEIKNLDKKVLTILDFVVDTNVAFPVKTAFKVNITDKNIKAVAIAHILKVDGTTEIVGYKKVSATGAGDIVVDCLFNSASPVVLIAFTDQNKDTSSNENTSSTESKPEVIDTTTSTDSTTSSKPATNPTTPATGGNNNILVILSLLMLSFDAIVVAVISKKKVK